MMEDRQQLVRIEGVSKGHLQKLKEAAERRKIQNRLAQRRYRENLKRKLESLERAERAEGNESDSALLTQMASISEDNVDEKDGVEGDIFAGDGYRDEKMILGLGSEVVFEGMVGLGIEGLGGLFTPEEEESLCLGIYLFPLSIYNSYPHPSSILRFLLTAYLSHRSPIVIRLFLPT
jgi:hypothetical protein